MNAKNQQRLFYAAVALSILVVQGCGTGGTRQPADKAELIVEEFLDAWSKGEPSDKYEGTQKRIVASDPDWKAGYRLLSFLSIETHPSQEEPSHFRCRVSLSLRDPNGTAVDKEVVYEIVAGEKYAIRRAAP